MSELEVWAVVAKGEIVRTDLYREGVTAKDSKAEVVCFVPYLGRQDPALKALKALLKAHEGLFTSTECLRLPAYVNGRKTLERLERKAVARNKREISIAAFDRANGADKPGYCKHKRGEGMCARCECYAVYAPRSRK